MDKIEKILNACKEMKFSLGDYEGMHKAESIIFYIKQYKRNELDLDMLCERLSGNGCPYDDIDGVDQVELCEIEVDKKEQDKQCIECWKKYLS